jgi:hypothetical protein
MLTLEEAIVILLNQSAELAAQVGGRIYGGWFPQDVRYPAVAYKSPPPGWPGNRNVRRTIAGGCSLVEERIHLFTKAQGQGEYGTASLIDRIVTSLLDEFVGVVADSSSPPNTLRIHGIFATEDSHLSRYTDVDQIHHFFTEFLVKYEDPMRV